MHTGSYVFEQNNSLTLLLILSHSYLKWKWLSVPSVVRALGKQNPGCGSPGSDFYNDRLYAATEKLILMVDKGKKE